MAVHLLVHRHHYPFSVCAGLAGAFHCTNFQSSIFNFQFSIFLLPFVMTTPRAFLPTRTPTVL